MNIQNLTESEILNIILGGLILLLLNIIRHKERQYTNLNVLHNNELKQAKKDLEELGKEIRQNRKTIDELIKSENQKK